MYFKISNINTNYKNLVSFVLSLILLSAIFFPSSSNGIIFSSSKVVVYYSFILFLLLILFFFSTFDNINLIISGLILLLLSVSTILSIIILNSDFSIARLAIVMFSLLIFNTKFYNSKNIHHLRYLFHFITIFIIFFNLYFLIFDREISQFLIDNYSQFNYYTVASQLLEGKPVFTFGVHTFASFFYFLLFYFWYINIKFFKEIFLYYFYIFFLLLFMILLRSYSSILMLSISLILLVLSIFKKTVVSNIVKISIFSSPIIIIFIIIFFNSQIQDLLFNESHGIFPRYFGDLFFINFEMIKRTILGLGFTIARDYPVVYTDSGPIVYITMGNFFFPILFYLVYFRFLKINLKKHHHILFFSTLLFELAIPLLIYLKGVLIILTIVYYQKNIYYEK